MHLTLLNNEIWFPPVDLALDDGLLAIGGDLSIERLLLAYRSGIFPWYDDDMPMWWSPDPRFVLYPENLRVSKSMKQLLKKEHFSFTINQAFEEVITYCKTVPRKDQDGTWINNDIVAAYSQLHKEGYAHSAEVWNDNKLVGGLYGIKLGKAFFGESMFSNVSNASKYAFIRFVQQLKKEGVQLIDCQIHTNHLERLGAQMITRSSFIQQIEELIDQ